MTNSGIYAGGHGKSTQPGFSPQTRNNVIRKNLDTLRLGNKKPDSLFNDLNSSTILNHIRENAKTKGIYIDFMNCHKEHIHCIISLDADQPLSKIIQLIKGESSFWINKNNLVQGKFEWADEYFAVSVSESQINKVREYIKNQAKHHQSKEWEEEYNEFVEKYGFKIIQG